MTSNKSVIGFNLSFFADEPTMVYVYMDQIHAWLTEGELVLPEITLYPLKDVATAHQYIQSGQSVGKIVVRL